MSGTHTDTASSHRLRRLAQEEDGVALVEFAIALPLLIVIFAAVVEGSRMMMAYQGAIAGVRDATRFLARAVPTDVCTTGVSISGYATRLRTMVAQSVAGESAFPQAVTVNTVTPAYACITGTYRVNPAPVATVTANVTIQYPFAGMFRLVGGDLPTLTTEITDRARIFGS